MGNKVLHLLAQARRATHIRHETAHANQEAGTAVMAALIQGASRGLGLQFCRHVLQSSPSAVVVATSRRPEASDGLQQLAVQHPGRLVSLAMDVSSEQSVQEAAQSLGERKKLQGGGLSLLVNCTGILSPSGRGETSLAQVTEESFMHTMRVNCLGALLSIKHFGPLLVKGASRDNTSKVVNLSARVGSVGDNRLGGWLSYRASKTALNMVTKNASLELRRKNVCVVSMHPGTVDTDLSRPYHAT